MTPLLILIAIPPAVAVASVPAIWRHPRLRARLATGASGSSISGSGSCSCRGDPGTASGVWFFALLRRAGQLDLFIALAYIVLLTIVAIDDGGKRAGDRAHLARHAADSAGPGTHACFTAFP